MDKNQFETSSFTIEPFAEKVDKPWGYEIHWAKTASYVGKLLHINKGERLSLQYHDKKKESEFLIKGKVSLWVDNNQGEFVEVDMELNKGYNIVPYQRHRFEAKEDADIIEVSTPEEGTTYRLEDDYHRGNETEEIRNEPNRGWKG